MTLSMKCWCHIAALFSVGHSIKLRHKLNYKLMMNGCSMLRNSTLLSSWEWSRTAAL